MANGFDAAYGWEFPPLTEPILQNGIKKASDIETYINKSDTLYAPDDMLMNFITNHDENSWAGTEYERMGNYVKGFCGYYLFDAGLPMLYTGQEAGLNKRLRFFEKILLLEDTTCIHSRSSTGSSTAILLSEPG